MRAETIGRAAGFARDVLFPEQPMRELIRLGKTALPEELVKAHMDRAVTFPPLDDQTPAVLIAARDEERDLPLTLLSLGFSDRAVTPIVVDNGSSDRTAEFATAMGATVWEHPTPGKSGALKFAFQSLASKGHHDSLLMTDADTIVRPNWAGHLLEFLGQPIMEPGGAVSGSLILFDDKKWFFNVAKSVQGMRRDWSQVSQGMNRAHGNNIGVTSGTSYDVVEDLAEKFDVDFVVGEDKLIVDIAGGEGRILAYSFNPAATVYARGDRIGSWKDAIRAKLAKGAEPLYASWLETARLVNANAKEYKAVEPTVRLVEGFADRVA